MADLDDSQNRLHNTLHRERHETLSAYYYMFKATIVIYLLLENIYEAFKVALGRLILTSICMIPRFHLDFS